MNKEKTSLLKPYTNNDKIKDMSVEERAEFICKITQCCAVHSCQCCPLADYDFDCTVNSDIKQWLESEAEK